MGDKNIVVKQMDKEIKNFSRNGFVRILPKRRKKINKLVERINPGNLEKKEIVV